MPVRHDATSAIAMSASIQKQSATAKAYVLAEHASGCRVHSWKMQEGKWNEVLADLYCACIICTESKTNVPSLRKFEGTRTPMSSLTGKYLISSTDQYFSYCHRCTEEAGRNRTDIRPGRCAQPDKWWRFQGQAYHSELRRHSTKSREYWHADTNPLGKTWNHMKDAFFIWWFYSYVICVSYHR